MLTELKTSLRNLLPRKYQVPAKYWYGHVRRTLECEMELLDHIVNDHDLVIDVGGNRGVYAYKFWRLGSKVEVFEPNPKCMDVLSAWANGKSSVSLHHVALSSCSGSATLHIPIDKLGVEHDASASIEHSDFDIVRDQVVPLKTLDSFAFESVKLIKIDVEGHELSVIEGAINTIVTSKPVLLIEIEQRHNKKPISDIFHRIENFGYQGYFMKKDRLVKLDKLDVLKDQAIENLNNSDESYINNFLFLDVVKRERGEYKKLFEGL
ncbi:FkbM family methyltransferase [uncultured Limnobacter sp.]|uniref:FkbM family methyltransferase n=1 Tax=uncultured Limnobacter sp. TaxID=199681 RepID=UPI0030FCECB5